MKTLILFTLLVSASFSFAQKSEKTESIIKSCITDYVTAFAKPVKESDKAMAKVRQKCLSKDFLKNWKKLVENSDADALLFAQDYQDSWITNVHIQNLDPATKTSKVILGKGQDEHCLQIKYTEANGQTKIAGSHLCDNGIK